MPQDDIGLRKDVPAERRAAILDAALSFRDELAMADQWEAGHTLTRRPEYSFNKIFIA